jgi:hypothetical protein
MNTIAPPSPSPFKKLPPTRRVLFITLGFVGGCAANALLGLEVVHFWTRKTKFVPYDTNSPDLSTEVARKHNPASNPPVCIDHAVRTVPLDKLKTTDKRELTRGFCAGIWSGVGYRVQRRIMERKYRNLPGREKMLWDREELRDSSYDVGTVITDHFQVLEKTDDKVVVRCGDSPLNEAPRPSDGLFSMEVETDKEKQTATFHLKSVFVDTTPEGKNAKPLPWHMQYLHRLYTKIMMESAIKTLVK